MNAQQLGTVLASAAERVALLNEFRTDDFQDEVAHIVNEARECWRGRDGELPERGSDPSFDALIDLADESEGSPTEMRDAADRALQIAGTPPAKGKRVTR